MVFDILVSNADLNQHPSPIDTDFLGDLEHAPDIVLSKPMVQPDEAAEADLSRLRAGKPDVNSRMRLAMSLALLVFLSGCTSTVAVSLDDDDANRIVVALERASIEATKDDDPNAEGKYRITVAREESGRALVVLRDEELPRVRYPGVLEAMDKNSLVPSQAAEHAQLVAGLAGDLQRTLEGVDGVLSARVHLNLPTPDPIRDAPVKSSASVLVSYRGGVAPLSDVAVQRIVAGGAPGLVPADVAVVMLSRPIAPSASALPNTLTRVGPFVVSRGSKRILEVGFPMTLAVVFALFWFVYYTRFSRLRSELKAQASKELR